MGEISKSILMHTNQIMFFVLILCIFSSSIQSRYTSCAPYHYGNQCDQKCNCAPQTHDCDDGPHGSGICTAILNIDTLPSTLQRKKQLIHSPFLASFEVLPHTFHNLLLDLSKDTHRRSRQVYDASGAQILPDPFKALELQLISLDINVASYLGMVLPTNLTTLNKRDLTEIFSGRLLLPGSKTFAHAYSGHQFGSWAGQLGDGRAITIGDRYSLTHRQHYEISLKGAGKTAFSRSGDGRAVLRNLCREYLAGTYLNALGVPTTGALALIASDANIDGIRRDEFYTGNPEKLRPGILVRVSPSFVRFGSFQHAAKRIGFQGVVKLARHVLHIVQEQETGGDRSYHQHFTDVPLTQHVPIHLRKQCLFSNDKIDTSSSSTTSPSTSSSCTSEFVNLDNLNDHDLLLCFFNRVVLRTAALIASWQSIGFAHGVMNTDNMAASGVTIDLNVFGLISNYKDHAKEFTPNYIDESSRYKFGNQQNIGKWNLQRIGDVLNGKTVFVGGDRDQPRAKQKNNKWLTSQEIANEMNQYNSKFQQCHDLRTKFRLGFATSTLLSSKATDQWMTWMSLRNVDFHLASRVLAELEENVNNNIAQDDEFVEYMIRTTGAVVPLSKDESLSLRDVLVSIRDAVFESIEMRHYSNFKEWQNHIRRVVPRYVMRTHALREIGEIVNGGDERALGIGWKLLSDPFRANFEEKDEDDQKLDALELYIKGQFEKLPSLGEKRMKTSCGGQ